MSEYQLITEAEFFHWLTPVLCLTVVLMFSSIGLLMRPISLFAGLIRRHVNLFSKLSLWSFKVMKACRSAMTVLGSCLTEVKIAKIVSRNGLLL